MGRQFYLDISQNLCWEKNVDQQVRNQKINQRPLRLVSQVLPILTVHILTMISSHNPPLFPHQVLPTYTANQSKRLGLTAIVVIDNSFELKVAIENKVEKMFTKLILKSVTHVVVVVLFFHSFQQPTLIADCKSCS